MITALCLVAALLLMFNQSGVVSPINKTFKGLWIGISLLGALISFLSDMIFRKFIPLLRNLWVVECAFVVFTLVFFFLLKISILK
jgi:formate-dependent nitrite reductase membrane component NrfD